MKNPVIFIVIALFMILEMFSQTSPEFTFNKEYITLKKTSNSSGNLRVFRGKILSEEFSNTSPILGKVIEEDTTLRFIPLIPFGWNQKYTLVYQGNITYFTLDIPEGYEHLSVKSIYPSAKTLPSNILKWYIYFSHPINETYVYEHVRFINATGDTLPRTTLSLENALISDNGKLLTVWIEPGRQKRNLIPNTQLGPVFKNKNTYKLVVLKTLKDIRGVPMSQDFTHSFLISSADRIKPNVDAWKIQVPKANSITNLIILCHESLDYGSLINNITVIDTINGKKIDGNWQFNNQESTLVFTPISKWNIGNYKVVFDRRIEDVAGNNLERLFDSEIRNTLSKQHFLQEYKIDFALK